jgi:hypothetical protein
MENVLPYFKKANLQRGQQFHLLCEAEEREGGEVRKCSQSHASVALLNVDCISIAGLSSLVKIQSFGCRPCCTALVHCLGALHWRTALVHSLVHYLGALSWSTPLVHYLGPLLGVLPWSTPLAHYRGAPPWCALLAHCLGALPWCTTFVGLARQFGDYYVQNAWEGGSACFKIARR